MSVSPKSAVFRGDGEELVEHLLFACHKHKIINSPLPSFGRELQPYFAEGEELPPLPNKSASCGSPPRATGARASGKASRKGASPPDRRRQQDQAQPVPKQAGGAAFQKRGPSAEPNNVSPIFTSYNNTGNQHPFSGPSYRSLGSSPSSSSIAACPAFFSSPKPDALPIPSLGLLNKACEYVPAPTRVCNGFAVAPVAA